MISILNYFIEANLALLIFLLIYRIVLLNETNFVLMRFFLLASVFVSLTFPLIHFGNEGATSMPSMSNVLPANWLPEIVFTSGKNPQIVAGNFLTAWRTGSLIYTGGLIIFAVIFIKEITSVVRLIRSVKTYRVSNFFIAESEKNLPTFSFFNFIFIGNALGLADPERTSIIEHESLHASQIHSADILVVSFLQIIFWFNPFIKLYKRYFVQLHEFEADARAVKNSDLNKYCSLLARVALQSADFSIANYFNNSLTIKRITMIRTIKKQMSKWKLLTATSAFPLIFFLLGFQDQVIAQEKSENLPPSTSEVYAQEKSQNLPISTSSEVYLRVDDNAVFKKGFDAMLEFIGSNMKYPKQAREKGVEGTVYVEFIVEKDGKLSEIKTVKGFSDDCDGEATRVVKLMPEWNPGVFQGKIVRTKMVLPIKFKLS